MKKILLFSILLNGFISQAQVGFNCQYFPGLQFGKVKVKTDNATLGTYKYNAGLPILMIDRIGNHWYTNVDLSALYYGATQTNNANDNRIKISKAEGGFASGRLGYLFGKGDQFRMGPNINVGLSSSNLDSLKKPFDQRTYVNLGLGVVVYKKFGKIRTSAKIGYERYSQKSFITKGHGTYLEAVIAYPIFQKYGLSVMPCFYSKKFEYTSKGNGAVTNAKVTSFAIRFGLTKFF
ncbi:MAG: hypothetical protein JNM51_16380 [Bacteroidia bacterium]|nr:hypothetical protein [Bacteroidia bacterium]